MIQLRLPILGLAASVLVGLPSMSQAQMSCSALVETAGRSTTFDTFKTDIYNEFGIELTDQQMATLDHLTYGDGPIHPKSQAEFDEIIDTLYYLNKTQAKRASEVLAKKVSISQATALRLARALGRNEQGRNPNLLAFSTNYTARQIHRKDRILQLAGFNLHERFALMSAKLVSEVITDHSAENLFSDQPTAALPLSHATTEATITRMEKDATPTSSDVKPRGLSKQGMDKIFKIMDNPFFTYLRSPVFDPKFEIGYCFGRATITHIMALMMGVKREDIRKVYVVGEMDNGTFWRYHVATAIRNRDGGWWVADPIYPGMTLREWFNEMKTFNANGDLRLYVTEPSRFGPSTNRRYTREELFSVQYNNYFVETMKYFKTKFRKDYPDLKDPVLTKEPAVTKAGAVTPDAVNAEPRKRTIWDGFFGFLDKLFNINSAGSGGNP